MTDDQKLPQTPEEVNRLMSDLTFDEPPSPEAADALLATLPPTGSEVMVVRSLRLPLDLDEAVSAAARTNDIPKSTWIRQAIEMALAMQAEEDQPISRSDALRALTLLRPARRVA